jgi:hypothetical protein
MSSPAPSRRSLQICLGLLWLLDAGLQFQPFMFRTAFVTQIIQPTAEGNPSIVSRSVLWSSRIMIHHIAIYNTFFAAIQLVIGLGLLFRGTVKISLAASLVWALFVWWFGEALGGIFLGSSPLAGVPGGVVLYALVSVLVWPTRRDAGGASGLDSVATRGPLDATVARLLWVVLWGSFCYYLLLGDNRAPTSISEMFAFTDGQPGWLTSVMNEFSRLCGHRGTEISIVLTLLCAFAALGILLRPTIRAALVVAAVVAVFCWIAEGLGGIFTGQGTDPNSGPLLILLAACYWPRAETGGNRRPA